MTSTLPQLWDKYDVAHWLGVLPARVQRMAREGELPAIRLPGKENDFVFEPEALREWLEKLKRRQAAEAATA
jgi:hypothetical protein